MAATIWLLALLAPLAFIPSSQAGEVAVYKFANCTDGKDNNFPYPHVLASDESTSCQELSVPADERNRALPHAVSTRRNIGSACNVSFYTDTSCTALAYSLNTSGPKYECLGLKQALRAYKFECSQSPSGKPLPFPPHQIPFGSDKGVIYYQPVIKFQGEDSGGNDVLTQGLVEANRTATYHPPRSISAAATAISAAFVQNLPDNKTFQYTVDVPFEGTRYSAQLKAYFLDYDGSAYHHSARAVFLFVGQAAFASLTADSLRYYKLHEFGETVYLASIIRPTGRLYAFNVFMNITKA